MTRTLMRVYDQVNFVSLYSITNREQMRELVMCCASKGGRVGRLCFSIYMQNCCTFLPAFRFPFTILREDKILGDQVLKSKYKVMGKLSLHGHRKSAS